MGFPKILVADDDPEDRFIIREAMDVIDAGELLGFAENGEAALSFLDEAFMTQSVPQLIVLDLNMPKMNGTETLNRIKEDARFRNIPVIIFSTSINILEREKCMKLGAHAYITKPISFNESVDTARTFFQFCND